MLIFLKKNLFISFHLKGRVIGEGRSSSCCFTPQMSARARAGPGLSQEPAAVPQAPRREVQSCLQRAHQQEAWLVEEWAGTQALGFEVQTPHSRSAQECWFYILAGTGASLRTK